MKFSHHLVILALGIAPSAHAKDGVLKHYRTGFIPKSYGTCEQLKTVVSDAFAKAANVRIISSQCESGSRGANIELTYASPTNEAIEIAMTRSLSDYDDVAGRGYMKTQKECEERKVAVTDQFRTATGLEPFFVRCMEDEAANETTHPWHVGIDAVGVGAMSYQYIDRMLSDGLTSDPEVFLSEIHEYFSKRPDTSFVDAVYRWDALDFARVGIAVFSKKRITLTKRDGVTTRKKDDCTFEADELRNAANLGQMTVISHGCSLHHATYPIPFVLLEGGDRLYFDTTGIQYETMEACRAARSSTFEDMRQTIGATVIGISCSNGTDKPEAFVIQKDSPER